MIVRNIQIEGSKVVAQTRSGRRVEWLNNCGWTTGEGSNYPKHSRRGSVHQMYWQIKKANAREHANRTTNPWK